MGGYVPSPILTRRIGLKHLFYFKNKTGLNPLGNNNNVAIDRLLLYVCRHEMTSIRISLDIKIILVFFL